MSLNCEGRRIYLDYASTTPIVPEVLEEMLPYFNQYFGNPSSLCYEGQAAKEAIEQSRDRVASLIKASPLEIVFTSGGTESNNSAFFGMEAYAELNQLRMAALVSAVEHRSVLEAAKRFSLHGAELYSIPVDLRGVIDLDFVEKTLARNPHSFVSVILVNNEVGTIQALDSLVYIVKKYDSILHCDGVAALGKVPIDLSAMPIDFLSLSAHKIYGPKGVGALYVRKGLKIPSFLVGGHQESGRRAGTHNVSGIVGFGAACSLAQKTIESEPARLETLKQSLWKKIRQEIPCAVLNSPLSGSVPGLLNVSFLGHLDEELAIKLDLEGVSVSTGAACSSGSFAMSHVLCAMNLPVEQKKSAVRISMGKDTSQETLDTFLKVLKKTFNT